MSRVARQKRDASDEGAEATIPEPTGPTPVSQSVWDDPSTSRFFPKSGMEQDAS